MTSLRIRATGDEAHGFSSRHPRLIFAFTAAELLLLGALFLLASLARAQGSGNLLLAMPQGYGAQGLDPQMIEDRWEGDFLITYETRRSEAVVALNSQHNVTAVGTNGSYRAVMGYRMLSGGFFSEAAMKDKRRHAVLNAAGAFALFGGMNVVNAKLKLGDEAWTVVGVMDDGQDDARVYVPASASGQRVQSLLALLDARVTKESAVNAFKDVGVYEDRYHMISLADEGLGYDQRFSVAAMAALCAALLLAIRLLLGKIARITRALREQLRDAYLSEFLSGSFPALLKALGLLLALLAAAALLMWLLTQILSAALALSELSLSGKSLPVNDFSEKTAWLREHFWLGNALLGAAALMSASIAALGWRKKKIHA